MEPASVDYLPAFARGVRRAVVPDVVGMRDHPLPVPPMERERGGLQDEMVGGVWRDIQRHLMRRARARAGTRSAETYGDRTMQMAGNHALDLRMPHNDLLELGR